MILPLVDMKTLIFIGLAVFFLFLFALDRRSKRKQHFRKIPGLAQLKRSIGQSVEEGNRLHVSVGSAGLPGEQAASGLAGLAAFNGIAQFSSLGDSPPLSTSGNASLALLGKETLRNAFTKTGSEDLFDGDNARMAGVTPFSYAAGTIPVMRHERVGTNLVIGNFGPESAFLSDAAKKEGTFLLGGSDALAGQAVLFATADEVLIGEETFASAAYLDRGAFQTASLRTQDILRWVLILYMLGGAINKMIAHLTGSPLL